MNISNSLNNVLEQFYREVRKLEVRLNDHLNEEEAFVTEIRNCITRFKSLHFLTSKLNEKSGPREIADALALKTNIPETFSKAIMQQDEPEHEGSHLLES